MQLVQSLQHTGNTNIGITHMDCPDCTRSHQTTSMCYNY